MRVIAYLFVGQDDQTRSTDSVDVMAYNSIAIFQGSVATVLVF